jgi:protein-tyrosine phosphatase
MVCMGNICRSPTAEAVLRHMVDAAGLSGQVHVDSAGTLDYHVGSPPDARSSRAAAARGYDLSTLRARQVSQADFARFDAILAMDWDNLNELQQECPPEHEHKLMRLMAFADPGLGDVVADPYYGAEADFDAVLDQVEHACARFLDHVRGELARG